MRGTSRRNERRITCVNQNRGTIFIVIYGPIGQAVHDAAAGCARAKPTTHPLTVVHPTDDDDARSGLAAVCRRPALPIVRTASDNETRARPAGELFSHDRVLCAYARVVGVASLFVSVRARVRGAARTLPL